MHAQDYVALGSLLHALDDFFAKAQCDPPAILAGLPEPQHPSLAALICAADLFARSEQSHEQSAGHLASILSKVSFTPQKPKEPYYLPLTALALTAEPRFPQATPPTTANDYPPLAAALLNEWQQVPNAASTPAALHAQARTFMALSEKYLSQVPAGADISLFDLQRIRAAIAQGLYHYHADSLATADFADPLTAKWRLVCGDFSGIQTFIYKITSKGAAKGLRGRSFFLQLLCDAVAEQLIRTLGLYATARIYSSGGKFYLLIPETKLEQLNTEVQSINLALFQQFRGEMCLNIGVANINANDFKAGNMGGRWQQANDDLMRNRQQAFFTQVADPKRCFAPEALHAAGACQVCDRDDAHAGIQEETDGDGDSFRICRSCKELRELGRILADSRYLLWAWGKDRAFVRANLRSPLRYLELCGTDCTVYFLADRPEFKQTGDLYECHLESLNNFDLVHNPEYGYSAGFRLVGKWDKTNTSGEFDFEHFAEHGDGVKRLGVLRMDVDNLGEVFIRGLNTEQQSMGSLSRIATLSRQLHWFFAGYLTTLITDYPLCQIIYAGGDDVFIIGSWQQLPQLANTIRNEFKRYCANNDHFSLSGGIALATGKYPISKIAEAAGEAEADAKHLKRGDKSKDALSFLGTVIAWESFDEAVKLKDQICAFTDNTNSHALIDRLRQVVVATDEIKKLPTVTTELLYWNQWRWRLIYNLKRMADRHDDAIKQDLKTLQTKLLQEPINNHQSLIDWLPLPVRWAEFLKRGDNNG